MERVTASTAAGHGAVRASAEVAVARLSGEFEDTRVARGRSRQYTGASLYAAGRRRTDRGLAARRVEPSAQHASGRTGQQPACGLVYRKPGGGGDSGQWRTTRGRGGPQCRAAL